MNTPATRYNTDGWTWAADNGCFSDSWQADKWIEWVQSIADHPIFAVVPDKVCDAETTRSMWNEWSPHVTDAGHTPAYVIQDGQDAVDVPWGEMGAMFIGGSTAFKLSEAARLLTAEAVRRGLWVHMGRVNSFRRLALADAWDCRSADGTFLAFGPDTNTPRLLAWLRRLNDHKRQTRLAI